MIRTTYLHTYLLVIVALIVAILCSIFSYTLIKVLDLEEPFCAPRNDNCVLLSTYPLKLDECLFSLKVNFI